MIKLINIGAHGKSIKFWESLIFWQQTSPSNHTLIKHFWTTWKIRRIPSLTHKFCWYIVLTQGRNVRKEEGFWRSLITLVKTDSKNLKDNIATELNYFLYDVHSHHWWSINSLFHLNISCFILVITKKALSAKRNLDRVKLARA